MELKLELEELFIKRRTANKDKDCQVESILTSLLGYTVLADERTPLEHLFRSCTDEFGFHKMYLQIQEYQQTVELIKTPEMVLSEITLPEPRSLIVLLKQQLRMPTIRFLMLTFNWLLTISCSSYMQTSTLNREREHLMISKAFTGTLNNYQITFPPLHSMFLL